MNDFLFSEDIANKWLVLNLDVLRKEVESKGGKCNVDGYCKGFVNNPNIKLPLAYVDEHGKVFFNEITKKWESPEEIERRLIEVWIRDMAQKPFVILLTRSLKELAEVAPDACACMRMLEWRGPK